MESIIIAAKLTSQIVAMGRAPESGVGLNTEPGGTEVRSAVVTVIVAAPGEAKVGETVSGET